MVKPREQCRKWESEYDIIIYDNGLLLPDRTFEPKNTIFVPRNEIKEIFWNEGHDYVLVVFNSPPKYKNKLGRKVQIIPKRYIDDHLGIKEIFTKYYEMDSNKVFLREDVFRK
jgi:hypothetical protein